MQDKKIRSKAVSDSGGRRWKLEISRARHSDPGLLYKYCVIFSRSIKRYWANYNNRARKHYTRALTLKSLTAIANNIIDRSYSCKHKRLVYSRFCEFFKSKLTQSSKMYHRQSNSIGFTEIIRIQGREV